MTNESAIDILSNANLGGVLRKAADMGIAALREQEEQDRNEPLTPDELRKMGGLPYYHVSLYNDQRWWAILDPCCAHKIEYYHYGEYWLAYRKPPDGKKTVTDSHQSETVTKCHDLYDEDGGEILEQDPNANQRVSNTSNALGGWISVKDRLPTKEDECNGIVGIVNGYNGNITFTDAYLFLRYDFNENAWWSEDYDIEGCKVTHWMSLPLEPPKEDQ